MQLSSINNISFGANLFHGGRRIDSGMMDAPSVSTFGLADTDIFIRRFSSMYNSALLDDKESYVNKITFALDSPLFGRHNFKNVYMGITPNCNLSSPIEADNYIYNFYTRDGVVKKFEDDTLRYSLLEEIYNAAAYNKQSPNNPRSTDALDILDSRLDRVNCINSNLTPQRISELYNIAREINNKVALEGSTSILNRWA